MIPTRNKRQDNWLPRHLSNWILLKSRPYANFDDAAVNGYPATRIYEACKGTELDWIAMCAVAACRTDYFRHASMDAFACGLGGVFGDQLVNACTEWLKVENVEDLKLSQSEISIIEQLHALMVGHCRRSAEAEADQPLPTPIPKPVPVPPKPLPTIPVVAPPVPPEEPKPAPEAPSWKKRFAWIGGTASTLLGAAFIWSLFLPSGVAQILKLVLELLKGVFQ
jgi:hypothetical protein